MIRVAFTCLVLLLQTQLYSQSLDWLDQSDAAIIKQLKASNDFKERIQPNRDIVDVGNRMYVKKTEFGSYEIMLLSEDERFNESIFIKYENISSEAVVNEFYKKDPIKLKASNGSIFFIQASDYYKIKNKTLTYPEIVIASVNEKNKYISISKTEIEILESVDFTQIILKEYPQSILTI